MYVALRQKLRQSREFHTSVGLFVESLSFLRFSARSIPDPRSIITDYQRNISTSNYDTVRILSRRSSRDDGRKSGGDGVLLLWSHGREEL